MIEEEFREFTINDLVKERITTTPNNISTMLSQPGYCKIEHSNSITCLAGGQEMLKVSDQGFWVRGVKIEQDDKEAEQVYNAFKAWMMWAQMTKDYK